MTTKHCCPNCEWFFANWQKILAIMGIAFVIGALMLALGAKVGLYTITFQDHQILP